VRRPGLWLLTVFALFFAVPLQVGLLPQILPGPWAPHLGLLTVFLAGFLYGEAPGVGLGLLLGILYDRFTVGDLGLHLLLLPLVGAGTAVVRRLVPEMDIVGRIVVLAVTVIVAEMVSAVLFDMAGAVLFDWTLVLRQFLPAVLANVLWGAVLLFVAGRPRRAAAL
jgi:rod shape-determining protein MreD